MLGLVGIVVSSASPFIMNISGFRSASGSIPTGIVRDGFRRRMYLHFNSWFGVADIASGADPISRMIEEAHRELTLSTERSPFLGKSKIKISALSFRFLNPVKKISCPLTEQTDKTTHPLVE